MALSSVPLRSGWAQVEAGLMPSGGPYVLGEAGYRVAPNVGIYGYGQADRRGPQAGVGVRLSF